MKRINNKLLKVEKKHKKLDIIQWKISDCGMILNPIFSEEYSTLLSKALEHLIKANPRFQILSECFSCLPFSPEGLMENINPFQSLCIIILSQQLSKHSSASIYRRFLRLFFSNYLDTSQDDKLSLSQLSISKVFPTPQEVYDISSEDLRLIGCSSRKIEYLKLLADSFLSGKISPSFFINSSDEDIIERLIAIKGIGLWSAEMFLLFSLKRTDILSTGDLGIQRGMALMKGKNISKPNKGKWKYMSHEEMIQMAEPWRPYRSIASWFIWRITNTTFTQENHVSSLKKY
ncbi:hypothetical protein PNEG_01434 [Pneumocystis murina B123]|uniref:HhH-GPD domain-containing protein n=1 Tax=Pneumocystis murina (strain B123) TaxID=1069680 RepID=M7P8G1_PNEMU|nr:hypothetical protein PNEG_01434 [Pneumocystis murina B123]EMR10160.1 hypothetical protein PNEG_01434 [Pneumocystis murina B123]